MNVNFKEKNDIKCNRKKTEYRIEQEPPERQETLRKIVEIGEHFKSYGTKPIIIKQNLNELYCKD